MSQASYYVMDYNCPASPTWIMHIMYMYVYEKITVLMYDCSTWYVMHMLASSFQ
jgi:hypothetical protein